MKERLLVTGASGFIGFHITEAALNAGYDVYAAVRRSSKIEHLSIFPITLVYLNFESEKDLGQHIAEFKYDYIIHAAGVTSALTEADYQKYNVTYTVNLARASANKIKKFVFVSSLAAIGPLNNIDGLITENSQPDPVTLYGKSKLTAETALKNINDLNYIIIRPTAVYGPRERGIFIMFKQLANRLEFYISRKEQKFSFVYCKDLAEVLVKALKQGSSIYNISDGNFYDRYMLANITKDILHLRTLKICLPLPVVKLVALVADKVSMITKSPAPLNSDKLNELTAINWNCSIDKAKKDLDFAPRYDLRKGIAETLAWYKKEKWL